MSASKTSSSEPKSSGNSLKNSILKHGTLLFVAYMVSVTLIGYRKMTNDPYSYILPNFMLFLGTPFSPMVTKLWRKLAVWDKSLGKHTMESIPEMQASEYTYEAMRELTNDFMNPAVVRGLFDGTPAQTLWQQPGHLSSKEPLNKMEIPVVKNSTYQGWDYAAGREVVTFDEAFEELLTNEDSVHYLFFPKELGGFQDPLRDATDKAIREELEIDRIFKGFASTVPQVHKVFEGAQIIAGRGKNNLDGTTGTDWHCAPGNNWFIQVVGRKRWYFMNQKYGAYMHPVVNSWLSFKTSLTPEMVADVQDYVPMNYVDLAPGDLLYNPDYYWHTVKNYGGLTIGVPLREFIIRKCFENNFQYTSIAVLNNIFIHVYQAFGGDPYQGE